MSDIAVEEYMMFKSYQKLREKHPNHELLRFLKLIREERDFEYTRQFWEKYSQGKEHVIHTLHRYSQELRQAAGEYLPSSSPRLSLENSMRTNFD